MCRQSTHPLAALSKIDNLKVHTVMQTSPVKKDED
jgi:hypothetical protein